MPDPPLFYFIFKKKKKKKGHRILSDTKIRALKRHSLILVELVTNKKLPIDAMNKRKQNPPTARIEHCKQQ
jgi:hypothetical protein